MQLYKKRANTSQQDVPSLSLSLLFTKSSPYHKRSTCPEVTVRGLENTDRTSSGDSELYPGILCHLSLASQLCPMSWLGGKRILLVEVVMTTSTWPPTLLCALQPQKDQWWTLLLSQVTKPCTWTSLIASRLPPDGTENVPNLSSFAPKQTGAVLSLIQASERQWHVIRYVREFDVYSLTKLSFSLGSALKLWWNENFIHNVMNCERWR